MQTQEKTESPKELWHNPFVDVQQEQWFAPGVQFVTERGWMRPWRDRRFGPRGVINKQTFYTILHRASCGSCGTAAELFPRGSEEPFPAEGGMSRQDMAVMLFRCSEKLNLDTSARGGLAAYSDASEVSEYAQDAMAGPWGQGSSGESKPAGSAPCPPGTAPHGRRRPQCCCGGGPGPGSRTPWGGTAPCPDALDPGGWIFSFSQTHPSDVSSANFKLHTRAPKQMGVLQTSKFATRPIS